MAENILNDLEFVLCGPWSIPALSVCSGDQDSPRGAIKLQTHWVKLGQSCALEAKCETSGVWIHFLEVLIISAGPALSFLLRLHVQAKPPLYFRDHFLGLRSREGGQKR